MKFVKIIFISALLGCSHSSVDQDVGDAIALYNQGKDDAAIKSLAEVAKNDASGSAESKLADIYILNGYFSRNVLSVHSGISYAENLKKTKFSLQNIKSKAYFDYFHAMAKDVEGDSKTAHALLSMHCTPTGDCDLIEILSDNALIDGSRYDAEVAYGVSSILLKYHMGSDLVIASNLSSKALLNYPEAERGMKAMRASNQVSPIVHDHYCRAIRLLPMMGETPTNADQDDCSR